MKWFRNLSLANKFFLLSLPLVFFMAAGILFLSAHRLTKDSSCGCEALSAEAAGEYQETKETAIFNNQPVGYQLARLIPDPKLIRKQEAVLGLTAEEKWIEVDLSEQKLKAHEGNRMVYEFLVSSGKWAPTPTGEFRIWTKLRYTKMSGGSRAKNTYYYLPNVPYTQYFYKDYGLHGTYWHHNFGQPMSHGCVNLSIPDAERLFYWTTPSVPRGKGVVYPSKDNPGTKVVVHE